MLANLVHVDGTAAARAGEDATDQTGSNLLFQDGTEPGGNDHVRVRGGIRILGASQIIPRSFGGKGADGRLIPGDVLNVVLIHCGLGGQRWCFKVMQHFGPDEVC